LTNVNATAGRAPSHGERYLKAIVRDHIVAAAASGDGMRERALKAVLREYIVKHPRCDTRQRAALFAHERRMGG
jgi:hypothetical protein